MRVRIFSALSSGPVANGVELKEGEREEEEEERERVREGEGEREGGREGGGESQSLYTCMSLCS